MGAVFRAWDLRLERPVAIKVVRADLISDPDSRARFRRESQIVARLQHPSIVTVFDYGTLADGAAFLVMEFVPGEDLRHFLKREKPLDPARMAALMTRHLRRRRDRAQVRHLPSRSQAGKHPAAGKRHGPEGRGLRRGEADEQRHRRRRHDVGRRDGRRDAGLHGAGAAARRSGRRARRRLQPRRDGLRDADGAAALRGRVARSTSA